MRLLWFALLFPAVVAASLLDRVEHRYADNDGVKIHYAVLGQGPLVVMIHGFPDFWYTWRRPMEDLADSGYRVAALDLRGFNKSDKPEGVSAYAMDLLVADVAAVVANEGREKAVVCGHDWGGAIAWQTAMTRPELVDRLIILNLPHPRGLSRELATNPEQQKNSAYARRFQQDGAHQGLTPTGLARWVTDPAAKPLYIEAFERSSLEAMMNLYKANYPREPYQALESSPPVSAPVLMFHGLRDTALHSDGLNGTWNWIQAPLTLVTVPDAGHFVQQDAADLVAQTMKMWLAAHR